jgi:hypothetical protein
LEVAKKQAPMHNLENFKLWLLNIAVLYFSFTDVEVTLKIISLLIAIGYTLRRWYLLETKNKKDETNN